MMQLHFVRRRAALALAATLAFALGGTSGAQSPAPSAAPSPAASPINVAAYDGTWSGSSTSETAQGVCSDYTASVTMQGGKGNGDGTNSGAGTRNVVYNYRTTATLSPTGRFELRFATDDTRLALQYRTAYFVGQADGGDTIVLKQRGTNTCQRTMTLKRS